MALGILVLYKVWQTNNKLISEWLKGNIGEHCPEWFPPIIAAWNSGLGMISLMQNRLLLFIAVALSFGYGKTYDVKSTLVDFWHSSGQCAVSFMPSTRESYVSGQWEEEGSSLKPVQMVHRCEQMQIMGAARHTVSENPCVIKKNNF